MEFHACKNCCLIDKVMENQIQKYDTLSKENIDIHNALIKSKDTIIKMESEILNLRDGLIAERQNNLRMHIQQLPKNLQQGSQVSMTIVVNPEPAEHYRNRRPIKQSEGIIPIRLKDKTDISLFTCNKLQNLVDKQKRMYEADLDLYRTLSDKCYEKLKQKLEEMNNHMSIMCEMCEILGDDFCKEREEANQCRRLVNNAIKTIKSEQGKQLIDIENRITIDVKNDANANVRQTVNTMKIQLADRDKLVTKLRQQQVKMETYMEKQEQEFLKQQQNHEQAIVELQKRLIHSEHKYKMLELRHSLEGEGFCTDITDIRKEIKRIKNKLPGAGYNCEIYPDIQKLEAYVAKLDTKIKKVYCLIKIE